MTYVWSTKVAAPTELTFGLVEFDVFLTTVTKHLIHSSDCLLGAYITRKGNHTLNRKREPVNKSVVVRNRGTGWLSGCEARCPAARPR